MPGCVDGWAELHGRFGKKPLAELLKPTIAYAREGFPVSELIAHYWKVGGDKLRDYPGFAETFLPEGRAPAKGDLFRNPALADTLQQIAAGGRDAFYRGPIAERIDAFCAANGCFLRKADLAAHKSEWVEPISVNYRGYDVWQLPPNTQGFATLQMLQILSGIDVKSLGFNSSAYLHCMIEAKKLVYEDRARFYADPRYNAVSRETLLSAEYAAERRKLIDPMKAATSFPAGQIRVAPVPGANATSQPGAAPPADALREADLRLREGDTIYLTVADEQRNIVSLIQSNYRGFGSGLCPTGLGFCLQDRGALFSLDADHPNAFGPGKRPFHTIIPGFVTREGKPWLSFGVMGGDMQPQGHVQVLCNLIDFGMNVQEAGDAPRWYHTGSSEPTGETMRDGGTVSLESGVSRAVQEELARRGHKIVSKPGVFGGYQAILYDSARDVYIAASESRKDGQASGY